MRLRTSGGVLYGFEKNGPPSPLRLRGGVSSWISKVMPLTMGGSACVFGVCGQGAWGVSVRISAINPDGGGVTLEEEGLHQKVFRGFKKRTNVIDRDRL